MEFDEPWAKEGAKPPDEETVKDKAGGDAAAAGAGAPAEAA